MNRRKFLKYAAYGTAIAGAFLAGYELDRWRMAAPLPLSTTTATESVTAPTLTQTVISTQTVTAGTLELQLFADWHGDGGKQNDENPVKNAALELTGQGIRKTVKADEDGRYRLNGVVQGRKYRLDFTEVSLDGHPLRFLSLPSGAFQPISDGYEFMADLSKPKLSLGLVHGFLTLPFPKGTMQKYEPSFVDIDLNSGSWITWQGNKQTYDGHSGTDFIIREGTKILAAAPGRVTAIGDDPNGGMWITIDHLVQGYSTFYSHLKEIAVGVGTSVARGQYIGLSGFSIWCRKPTGAYFKCHADHLHFETDRGGRYVDPYRSRVAGKGSTETLWTKDNAPQYPAS